MKLFVRVTIMQFSSLVMCSVVQRVFFYCPGQCSAEGAASSVALLQCRCHWVSIIALRPVYSYKVLF